MTTGDLPTGRRGRYFCPFCPHFAELEREMIQHRSEGECAELRNALRTAR